MGLSNSMEFAGLIQNQNFDWGNVAEGVDASRNIVIVMTAASRDASDESR